LLDESNMGSKGTKKIVLLDRQEEAEVRLTEVTKKGPTSPSRQRISQVRSIEIGWDVRCSNDVAQGRDTA
jgi:hypothetical protein